MKIHRKTLSYLHIFALLSLFLVGARTTHTHAEKSTKTANKSKTKQNQINENRQHNETMDDERHRRVILNSSSSSNNCKYYACNTHVSMDVCVVFGRLSFVLFYCLVFCLRMNNTVYLLKSKKKELTLFKAITNCMHIGHFRRYETGFD